MFPWLDLLRYIAAWLVAASHARTLVWVRYDELDPSAQGPAAQLLFALTRLGGEAVVLFFVLSGFLVGGKLIERCRSGQFCAASFAIDRATRILLPLLPVLLITPLIRHHYEHEWFLAEVIGNVLFLQGITQPELGYNHPLWSLPYEVWCYAMAMAGGLLWFGRWRLLAVLLIAAGCWVFWVPLVPWYGLIWLLGALLYPWRAAGVSTPLFAAGGLIAVIGLISTQFADGLLPESALAQAPWMPGYYSSALILGAGLAICVQQLVQRPPSGAVARGAERLGHYLARSSYSLYLSHFVVLQAMDWGRIDPVDVIDLASLWRLLWILALCQLVAELLYWGAERHTGAVRAWLRRARGAIAGAGPAH